MDWIIIAIVIWSLTIVWLLTVCALFLGLILHQVSKSRDYDV